MRFMTALKYFRMMEEKTGKKGVIKHNASSCRSTFETTPGVSIRTKKYMSSFGQRYVLRDNDFKHILET